METPNTGTGDSEAMEDYPIDTAGHVLHNRGTSVDYYASSEAMSKSSKANSLSALYGSSTGKEYLSTTNVSTATAFPNSRASPTQYGVKIQESKEVEKHPQVSICDLVVKYYFIAFRKFTYLSSLQVQSVFFFNMSLMFICTIKSVSYVSVSAMVIQLALLFAYVSLITLREQDHIMMSGCDNYVFSYMTVL